MEKDLKIDDKSLLDKWADKFASTRLMRGMVRSRYTIKALFGLLFAAYFITISVLGIISKIDLSNFTIFMSIFTNMLVGVILLVSSILNLAKKEVSHILYLNSAVLLITILILDFLDDSVPKRNLIIFLANYISPILMFLFYTFIVNNTKTSLTSTIVTAPIVPAAFISISLLTKSTLSNVVLVAVVFVILVILVGITYVLYQINRLFFNLRMKFFDAYVDYINNKEESKPKDHTNPWELLNYDAMKNLGAILKSTVVGQEEAISRVEKIILKAYMGISGMHMSSSKGTPRGIMFFVGPTGVGKTELSKALAKFVFNDESAIIRFDMSEYAQENSDQKLIGAPPGFVGFKEGGLLTNAVKKNPFSIILFDEIEKAAKPNPRILDLFLQILEDGRLTDSKGETVHFNESIIIFTSNLGAADIDARGTDEQVRQSFTKFVKEYFQKEIKRPELLGRIGESNIIPFNFIRDKSIIERIVLSKLKHIQKSINARYKINLLFEDEIAFIQYIFGNDLTITSGRTVINKINDALLDNLAVWMFNNKPELEKYRGSNFAIVASVVTGQLTFKFVTLSKSIAGELSETSISGDKNKNQPIEKKNKKDKKKNKVEKKEKKLKKDKKDKKKAD